MPRAKQRTDELRSRLIDVAITTLAAEGTTGFTTRRIADAASTSAPAIYELFGDRAGLVRAVFYAGFDRLGDALIAVPESSDARADLVTTMLALRRFSRENPWLVETMFARPFSDFDPSADERAAGAKVRTAIVGRIERCVADGTLAGNATDIGHVLLALCQGLATQERGGWLGGSAASNRRWRLGIEAVLDGCSVSRASRRRER